MQVIADLADDASDLGLEPRGGLGFGEADIEAHHRHVRHHVQRRAAVDAGDIDGDAVALTVQAVQFLGHAGGADDGVAAGGEVTAGVGRAAVDDDVEVARALARRSQRAVSQGRLIGQANMALPCELGEHRPRGDRADLLVGRQQHAVADVGGVGMALERLQRREHDRDAALHVGNAGAMECAVGAGADNLERARLGIDGVIVAGQHDLNRRFWPHDHR